MRQSWFVALEAHKPQTRIADVQLLYGQRQGLIERSCIANTAGWQQTVRVSSNARSVDEVLGTIGGYKCVWRTCGS